MYAVLTLLSCVADVEQKSTANELMNMFDNASTEHAAPLVKWTAAWQRATGYSGVS